jgi:hypothetical protein
VSFRQARTPNFNFARTEPAAAAGATGTIDVTLDAFTSAITGTTTIIGTIGVTMAAFTSSITGNETVIGTINVTMAAFTSAITGTTTVLGTIAQTLQNFTSAITGTTTVLGTIGVTLADFTSAIVGDAGAATSNVGRWIVRQIGNSTHTAYRFLVSGARRNRNN